MNILVIHDRGEVRREIVKLCRTAAEGNGLIVQARDIFQLAMRSGRIYSILAIIDLTLPHIEGKFNADYDTAHGLIVEIMESPTICAPEILLALLEMPRQRSPLGEI